MNTTRSNSFSAFFAAACLTVAMLAGVNALATSEPSAQLLAQLTSAKG